MNILITGGTGLIGQALITEFIKDGHQISILTRNTEKALDLLPSEVISLKWDGSNILGWSDIIKDIDAVINLAGESIAGNTLPAILTRRWTHEQKRHIQQSRLNAGKILVEAIKIAPKKPKVFIQASAVGYYGPQGEETIPEYTSAGTDFLAKVCQTWEDSTNEVEEMGIRRVVIRTGLVLAPEGGILPMMFLPFHLFVGGPIGGGKQFIPWIHLDDHVSAIRFLLENEDTYGAYNLSSPNPVNNAKFGEITGQVLRRPNWFPLPGFALKLVLGEKSTLVLDGQRAVPQRLLKAGYGFRFETLESALQDLQSRK